MPPKKDKDAKLFNLFNSKKFKECEQQIVSHIINRSQCDELTWLSYSHNKLICQYFLFRKNDVTLIDELIQLIQHFVKQPIFKKKKKINEYKSNFEFLNGQDNQMEIETLPLYYRFLRICQTILALCIKHQRFQQADIICDIILIRNGQNWYYMNQKIFFYFYYMYRGHNLNKMVIIFQLLRNFQKIKSEQLLKLPQQIKMELKFIVKKMYVNIIKPEQMQTFNAKQIQNVSIYEVLYLHRISQQINYKNCQNTIKAQRQEENNSKMLQIASLQQQYDRNLLNRQTNPQKLLPQTVKMFQQRNVKKLSIITQRLQKLYKQNNNAFSIASLAKQKINSTQVHIFYKIFKVSRQECNVPDNLIVGHYANLDRILIQSNLFLSLLSLRKTKYNCQMAYSYMKNIQKSLDYNYKMYYRKGQCCLQLYQIILQQNQELQSRVSQQQQNNLSYLKRKIKYLQSNQQIPNKKEEEYDRDINRRQFEKHMRWMRLKSLLEEAQTNFRSCLICLNHQRQNKMVQICELTQQFGASSKFIKPLLRIQRFYDYFQQRVIEAISYVYLCLGKYVQCLKLINGIKQLSFNLKIYKMQCQMHLDQLIDQQIDIGSNIMVEIQTTQNYHKGKVQMLWIEDILAFNLLVASIIQDPFNSIRIRQLINKISENAKFNQMLSQKIKQIEIYCRYRFLDMLNQKSGQVIVQG